MDNDWVVFLSQQPGIDEVNFLPKIALSKNGYIYFEIRP